MQFFVTRSNRYQRMNFFLEFVPMNLWTMEELRLRTVVERGNKANLYIVNIYMLHYGISGHFQALANVLKRRIKIVSPENKLINKHKKQVLQVLIHFVMYIYIFVLEGRFPAESSSSFLHFSRNTDIKGPDGCLDIAL